MKRLLLVFLIACFSEVGYGREILENFFTPDGGSSPMSLQGGQKLGQRFTATLPFEGIEVNGPTWGVNGEKGMTIRLYRWVGNYVATVAQEPIVTRVLVNLNDNDWFPVDAPTELPPGEYFWEASEPNNSNPDAVNPHMIGCWLWNESKYTGGEAYLNGVPFGEVSLSWTRMYSSNQAGAWTPFPFPVTEDPSLAQIFYAYFPFQGVGIASPTWNGVGAGYRMSLYRWNVDYDRTVSQSPIVRTTIVNHPDNGRAELILESPQPEGTYLLVTDQPVRGTGNIGHWGWMNSSWWDIDASAFANGVEIAGFATFDLFVGEPVVEAVGRDFASRSVTGVATRVADWSEY